MLIRKKKRYKISANDTNLGHFEVSAKLQNPDGTDPGIYQEPATTDDGSG